MIPEDSILEARNITKIYPNDVRAKRSVNLSVGEICCGVDWSPERPE